MRVKLQKMEVEVMQRQTVWDWLYHSYRSVTGPVTDPAPSYFAAEPPSRSLFWHIISSGWGLIAILIGVYWVTLFDIDTNTQTYFKLFNASLIFFGVIILFSLFTLLVPAFPYQILNYAANAVINFILLVVFIFFIMHRSYVLERQIEERDKHKKMAKAGKKLKETVETLKKETLQGEAKPT